MPDVIDQIQDVSERHLANSLQHRERVRANRPPGLTQCEDVDCRADIAPARTEMGARLCVGCQTAEEARGAQHAAWGRR